MIPAPHPPSTSELPRLAELPGRPCALAAALEVVGERWALLVVREVLLGHRRFTDIVRGTGAPRDRVAARLRSLEHVGVIRRQAYQTQPVRYEYELTTAGRELDPVLHALWNWGQAYAVAADDPDRHRAMPSTGP